MEKSGWLVSSLLCGEQEFSTGVTRLLAYLGTHQGGNKSRNLLQP
jgi:hypothetical protein